MDIVDYSGDGTMRAVAILKAQTPLKLAEISVSKPKPKKGHHIVKVLAASLSPVDVKVAQCGLSTWQFPHVLGSDAVGVVVDSGGGAEPAIGAMVAWHHDIKGQGVLAEYVSVPSYALAKVPNKLSATYASCISGSAVTAYLALERLKLSEDKTVLIKGAAGSIGQFAVQIAKNIGHRVFTTSRPEHTKRLKSLGADQVFTYQQTSLKEEIFELTAQRGVDAIIDILGGETTGQDLGLLKYAGSLACLTTFEPIDKEQIFTKSPTLISISLNGAWLADDMSAQLRQAFITERLLECVANDKLKVPHINAIPFSSKHIQDAFEALNAGNSIGKFVVDMSATTN